ncbi:TPA: LamG domain-containing protein [Klebsiella pneumoniae]|nr:LamG domain-containing protein [Klebsiella pneumoniae]HBZ7973496.1 hypothetical protein [Klebsiella pneumoniae]
MNTAFIGGIETSHEITNPALPIGPTIATAILVNEALINWFQAEFRYIEMINGDISAFIDLKGSHDRLVRKGVNNGATLVPEVLNGFSVAQFNSSESDLSIFDGNTLDLTKPFSWAGVACLKNNTVASNLMGTFTSQTVRAIINAPGGKSAIKFQYGTVSTNELPITIGEPFTFAAGFDGQNIFLRVNGVTTAAPAAGSPSISPLAVGALPGGQQYWDGYISDLFICNAALNSDAGKSLLTAIQQFSQEIYKLPF